MNRHDVILAASREANRYAKKNGGNLKTVAASAGHPSALVRNYGKRYVGYEAAQAVLIWLNDMQRQMAFEFDEPLSVMQEYRSADGSVEIDRLTVAIPLSAWEEICRG